MKNIMLIGFMGAGKTTIAKELAKLLNRPFIDTDEQIEQELGMPTTEIFSKYGEAFFRKKEKEHILSLIKKEGKVVALGGGAFLQEEIRNACLDNCFVVYLDLSWKSWLDRLGDLITTRPILQQKSEDEIKQLFEERKAYYSTHHLKVNTDGKSPQIIPKEIIERLDENA